MNAQVVIDGAEGEYRRAEQFAFRDGDSTIRRIGQVTKIDNNRFTIQLPPLSVSHIIVDRAAVGSGADVPTAGAAIRIGDPYPNPASLRVGMTIALGSRSDVRIDLLDLFGRSIARSDQGIREAGDYVVEIPIAGIPGGTYYCRVIVQGRSYIRPVVVVR